MSRTPEPRPFARKLSPGQRWSPSSSCSAPGRCGASGLLWPGQPSSGALWPLYQRTQQRWPPGRHNVLLPALFTVAVALVFILPLVLALFEAAREAHDILQWVREIQAAGLPVPEWIARLPFGKQIGAWWHDNLAIPAAQSGLWGRVNHERLLALTREFGAQLVHRIVLFAFTVLTLFFVFRDGPALAQGLLTASDRMVGPRGERIGRQMIASVHATVNGLVLGPVDIEDSPG